LRPLISKYGREHVPTGILGAGVESVANWVCLLLCRHDRSKAVEILVKDLKVFASFNEELFKEITQLLTLENFRYECNVPKW
jgi:hypothetical protein